jgi:ribokinase
MSAWRAVKRRGPTLKDNNGNPQPRHDSMILVIGSINLDFVATASRLPQPGETVSGSSFAVFPGGKGANQALACRRAGAKVAFAGCVGDDANSSVALKNLRSAGIDLRHVRTVGTDTGVASILVGESGENMIISVPGANGDFVDGQVEEALDALGSGDFLLLQLEIPVNAIRAALSSAKRRGIRSILNLSPMSEEAAGLAGLADIVIVNETELAALGKPSSSGANGFEELIKASSANDQVYVVTRGEDGAFAVEPGRVHQASAPKIDPVDTVGAGDTFAGYFAADLDQGEDLKTALIRATYAASLACLVAGAQDAIPHASEVTRRVPALKLGG